MCHSEGASREEHKTSACCENENSLMVYTGHQYQSLKGKSMHVLFGIVSAEKPALKSECASLYLSQHAQIVCVHLFICNYTKSILSAYSSRMHVCVTC